MMMSQLKTAIVDFHRGKVELDSMDFLDIIMELRKKYGIEVPEADYANLATINSSVNY